MSRRFRAHRVALLVVGLLLIAGPGRGEAQVTQLLPVDEAGRQPGVFTARAQLLAAIARRDTAALLSAVAADIRNGFGGDDGRDAFRARWKPADPASPLWEELATALALGGSFMDDSTFVAPYVFSRWPADRDAFEFVAVVGSEVRVRERPAPDAPVVRTVSFAVLPRARNLPAGMDSAGWEPVQLDDGKVGFIAARYVRSPVGYRAFLVRRGSAVVLTAFVAGD